MLPRRAALLLFLSIVLASMFLHHPGTGWNVNTRLNLVFAVVDQHTFAIDDYHDLEPYRTNDKAFFEGHFYSDKIFGVSLLALPVYVAVKGVCVLLGSYPSFHLSQYVMTKVAVTLPAAAAAVMLAMLLVRLGAVPWRAIVASWIVLFGSLAFGFATVFFPYLPGIACVLATLVLLTDHRWSTARAAACGFLLGYAMLCDLTFGLVVMAVGVLLLGRLWAERGHGSIVPLVAALAAGAAPLALFAVYSYSIFGEATIPYKYEYLDGFREGMSHGVMGVTAPKLGAAWFLTFHPYRGILFWSPWILVALAGGVALLRGSVRERLAGALALFGFVAYLLFNSGYYMWWGGWCMGPRLMLPMFAAMPLGLAWATRPTTPRWAWWALLVTGAVAVVLSLPLSMSEPQIPQGNSDELLYNPTFGGSLEVPQFVYLRAFFELLWLRTETGAIRWPLVARFVGCTIAAVGGVTIAAIDAARSVSTPESKS